MSDDKSQSNEVLGVKMDAMATNIAEIKETVSKLADGVAAQGVIALKVTQAESAIGRAFSEIQAVKDKDIEPLKKAVEEIKTAMPQLKRMETAVTRAVYGSVGVLCLAVIKTVVIDPLAQQRVVYVATQPAAAATATPVVPQPPTTINIDRK